MLKQPHKINAQGQKEIFPLRTFRKSMSLIGGLVSSFPAVSQTLPPSNGQIYLKPEMIDYLPAVGAGIVIGFVLHAAIISIIDYRFWKNFKV